MPLIESFEYCPVCGCVQVSSDRSPCLNAVEGSEGGTTDSLQMSSLVFTLSDGMPLLKLAYVVFLRVQGPLWEPFNEVLLLIFLLNGAPCPPFSVPLSATFFLPHTGCQPVLTMNQSFGGFFDCRWGEEVTGMHGFSLSVSPSALNN